MVSPQRIKELRNTRLHPSVSVKTELELHVRIIQFKIGIHTREALDKLLAENIRYDFDVDLVQFFPSEKYNFNSFELFGKIKSLDDFDDPPPRAIKLCRKVIDLLTLAEGKDISNIELIAAHNVISHFPYRFDKELRDKIRDNLGKRHIPNTKIINGRLKICDMGIHTECMKWLDS